MTTGSGQRIFVPTAFMTVHVHPQPLVASSAFTLCVCVCWTHQVSRRSFLMLFCIRGAFFVFDAVQMKIGRFNKNKVCKVSNLLVSFHIFLTKGFKRAHEGSWTAEGDVPPPTEDN